MTAREMPASDDNVAMARFYLAEAQKQSELGVGDPLFTLGCAVNRLIEEITKRTGRDTS